MVCLYQSEKDELIYSPGIGGFMVRQRSRPGQGPGKAKRSLCRKDSSGSVSEIPVGKDEGK